MWVVPAYQVRLGQLHLFGFGEFKQIICRARNRMLICIYIYDNLQPMSSTCSLYPDYSSLRRPYKNLAYALTLGR